MAEIAELMHAETAQKAVKAVADASLDLVKQEMKTPVTSHVLRQQNRSLASRLAAKYGVRE